MEKMFPEEFRIIDALLITGQINASDAHYLRQAALRLAEQDD